MTALKLVMFAATSVLGVACTSSSSGACTSTSDTGPCTGTFMCGNSGIQGACDRSTQVCVVQPGQVNCVTVPNASATQCPSEAEAESLAGCTTPFVASCSGSTEDGITVTCKN